MTQAYAMKIWYRLQQPYPLTEGTSGMWQTALVGGGFYLGGDHEIIPVSFQGGTLDGLERGSGHAFVCVPGGAPQFYRCHRTCLVNLYRVYKVSGNAQGYKLHVEGVEELSPVSRSLNEVIREKLG
jgi:hypothetical protein